MRLARLTHLGRINLSVSRAKFFRVFVGDLAASPVSAKPNASAADDKTIDDVADDKTKDNVVDDAADEILGNDAKSMGTETTMKPLRQLFEFYKAQGVTVDQSHADLP